MDSKTKTWKQLVGWTVLVATVGLFIYYIHTHPQFWTNIRSVSPAVIVLLIVIYSAVLLTNAAILYWSVQICRKTIGKTESMLLTAYSTLVNFFGPLQSGPGFRALYLKKKHDVSIKSYGLATLLYYASFGAFSLLMIAYGLQPLLTGLGTLIILGGAIGFGVYITRKNPELIKYPKQIISILLVTALQIAFTTTIYFVELGTVNGGIHFSQAIVYTGAANLSLYVSLTPGAIGFREAFLLFTRRISHIDAHTILAASVIDRAVYFVFLGLLFLLTAGFHAKKKFADGTES